VGRGGRGGEEGGVGGKGVSGGGLYRRGRGSRRGGR
jgi:hypothetical protein